MAFSGRDYQEFCTHFKTISEELDAIGLKGPASIAEELHNEARPLLLAVAPGSNVEIPTGTMLRLGRGIQDLNTVVRVDFKNKLVLVVPADKADYFEPGKPLFGTTVDERFKKKARFEIGEAGKCLALQRYTSCVFHLMRTVETAIEALRACLGLPVPTRDQHKAWGAILGALQTEIDKRNSDLLWPRQWSSADDKKFFEQVQMSLIAIKDGCRDDTMHVESTYTEDEANLLFALTKGFMQKVASRLDENGRPFA